MPIYSYRCDCGVEFDEHRSMTDYLASATCPRCEREAKRKFVVQLPRRAAQRPERESSVTEETGSGGIALENCVDAQFRNVTISGFDRGLVAKNSSDVWITQSTFRENRIAVENDNSTITIDDSTLK